jgi:hypothetical protein
MDFLNVDISTLNYENYPFPHIVIDNFIKNDYLNKILKETNLLNNDNADMKFIYDQSITEYNKFAFQRIDSFPSILKNIFFELNSTTFIKQLESLTGIHGIIANSLDLQGAGIHRIENNRFLQVHTDFNSYTHPIYGKLDRRINLLLYLNPD